MRCELRWSLGQRACVKKQWSKRWSTVSTWVRQQIHVTLGKGQKEPR